MRYPTISAVLAAVMTVSSVAWADVSMAPPSSASATRASGPEGPAEPPAEAEAEAEAEAPQADAPAEGGVEAAREKGDLSRAAELATEARKAEPTPDNWHREGQILEEMGDLEGAAKAYEGELAALPEDDPGRKSVRGDLQRVRDKARGRVESEPASTHRAELDKQWAPSPKKGKKSVKRPEPVDKPPEGRIVRKWYFWVTVAAIVASAAAVTGIAIKAARDERRDALDLNRRPSGLGLPTVIRF